MSKTNELIQRILGEPVRNIMHAIYDDYVEANVRFRSKSGMETFIIRREVAKCCDWCHSLSGVYRSGEEPDNIYKRHDNCRCMVTFRSEKGIYTDVWSKKDYQTQKDARIARMQNIIAERESRKLRGLSIDSEIGFYQGLTRKEIVKRYRKGRQEPNNKGIIAKKILNGEYDLNYKSQKYEQHTKGHVKYDQATKGRKTLQSYLTITKTEAQELIYKYAGTGIISKKNNYEYIDADEVIGYYHDKNGKPIPTKRFVIIHAKGGAHIVPVKEQ